MINEIARCLNMPFNIAAGNSSGYNYASGWLDDHALLKYIAHDLLGRQVACSPTG